MNTKERQELKEFALDHYRHFDFWPVEFESGKETVYEINEYWDYLMSDLLPIIEAETTVIFGFGTAVRLVGCSGIRQLQAAAINQSDGSLDEWVDVSAPESQDFLDKVNINFKTSFVMSDFAGR